MSSYMDWGRRADFAGFLERLAAHEATEGEWRAAVLEHYQDDLLESVRRECVRLLYDVPNGFRPAAAEQRQLRAWARALAESCSRVAAG